MSKSRPTQRNPLKTVISVALYRSMVDEIQSMADAEDRSRNGQIEHFLKAAVARRRAEINAMANAIANANAITPGADQALQMIRARAAKPTPPPTALRPPRLG